jgi:hypothetical protein
MFERGPAFDTLPGFKGAILARYPHEEDPLESGMIVHSEVLHDKIAALEVSSGRGRIFLNALYQYDDPPMPNEAPTASGGAPAAGPGAAAGGAPAAAAAAAGQRRRTP